MNQTKAMTSPGGHHSAAVIHIGGSIDTPADKRNPRLHEAGRIDGPVMNTKFRFSRDDIYWIPAETEAQGGVQGKNWKFPLLDLSVDKPCIERGSEADFWQ